MIILEGADGTGKTHAAKKICDAWDLTYRHMSRPPEDFDHASEYVERVFDGVQDRFHLGALVYGRILGTGTYPSAETMRQVQAYLRWQGCLVVVLVADRDWLSEQLTENTKKEMYSDSLILDANEAYRALSTASNRGEPYADIVYDVSDGWPTEDTYSEWVMRRRALWAH